jgi:dienelactone hydrolase
MLRPLLCAVLLGVLLSSGAAADPGGALPSIAELAQPAAMPDPEISPDGRWLVERSDGPARIALTDLLTRTTRPIDFAGQQLGFFRWAGNGQLILDLSSVERRGGRNSRLVAYDIATARQTLLAGTRAGDEVIHVDRAGGFVLVRSQAEGGMPSVQRIDLASGKTAQVVGPQAGVWDWYVDAAGVVRAGVGASGRAAWLLYRSSDGERFRRPARGAHLGIEQLAAVRGSDQGYAIAEGPGGRTALYRYDFARSALGAMLYQHPRVDLDGLQLAPDGTLLRVDFAEDRDGVRWFDAGLGQAQAAIDAALPDRVNRIVSMSDDRQRLVVMSSAPTDPGTFHLYDRAIGVVQPLMAVNPEASARRLSAMTSVRYRARDGLEIPGYLTLPAGREARSLPLIVMPHGGPFARDSWSYDPWVQYLAAKGYAVLQPNFRGSTGFGLDFLRAGNGEWGRGMQDDVDDGVAWLAKQGMIDSKRVCIMGASYGGYAALWATVRNPQAYRCAISFAGISDIAAQLAFDRKTFEPGDFKRWQARIQGKAPSLDSLSPLTFADRIATPLLIAHGSEDETVPVGQAQMLHAKLTKLGRAHDYRVYAGEGHDLEDPANIADFLTRVGAFLDAHNPA